MNFLRSRRWVAPRRVILILIVVVLGYRSYGDSIAGWFRGPDPAREIVITHSEFVPDVGGERPVWIIRLRNDSSRTTYDEIALEATYVDDRGAIVESDRIVIKQRLAPGEEKEVPSRDPKSRDNAADATLKVLDATVIEQ